MSQQDDIDIRIGADPAALEAGVARAKRAVEGLGETVKQSGGEAKTGLAGASQAANQFAADLKLSSDRFQRAAMTSALELQKLRAGTVDAEKASKNAAAAADGYLQSLSRQALMMGRTTAEQRLLEVGYHQMDAAQRASALSLVKSINAYERHQAQAAQLRAGMIVVGTAVGAAAAAFAYFAKETIAADARLDDMAESTGATVEKLSALRRQAEISGQNFDQVGTSLTRLSKGLAKIGSEDGSQAARALRAVGLSAAELRAMDPAEALLKVAKAFDGFADSGGKGAAAEALMGRGAAQLLPYMKDLAEQTELTGTATAETAAQAEKFEKDLARLRQQVVEAGRGLVREMVPALSDYAEELRISTELTGGFIDSLLLFGTVNPALQATAGNIAEIRREIEKTIAAKARQEADPVGLQGTYDYDSDLARLEKKSDVLKALQRRAALANAGPDQYDARDLAARPPKLDLAFDDGSAARAAKEASTARLRAVEAGIAAEVAAVKAGEKEKLDLISHAEKLGTLSLEQAGQARVQAVAEAVAEEVGELIKLAKARQAAGDVKGYADAEKQIAEAMRRVAGASREAAQALALFDKAQRDAFYGQQMQEVAAIDQVSEGLRAQTRSLDEQAQFFGMTEEAIYRYRAAQVEASIVVEDGALADSAKNEALRDQAAAYRNLADASASVAGKQLAKKEADEAAAAWKDFSRDIEQSLTDALYRSFEAGGSFGEAFADNLERTFKAMALKYAIQYVVSYAGNAASGFVGNATNGAVGNASAAAGQWGGSLVSVGGKWVYQQASPYVDSTANYIGSLFGGGSAAVGTYAGYGTGIAATSSSGGLASSVYGSSMANATPAASSSAAAGASGTSWLPIIGWIIAGMTASNNMSKQGLGYRGSQFDQINADSGGTAEYSLGNMFASILRGEGKGAGLYASIDPLGSAISKSFGINARTADILSAAPFDNNLNNWLFGEDYAIAGSGLQLDIRDNKMGRGLNYQDWWSGGGRFHGSESGTNYGEFSGDQSALIQGLIDAAVTGFIEPFNAAFETDLNLDLQFRDSGDKLFSAIDQALVKSIENSDVRDLFVGITDSSGMLAALQSFAQVQTMLAAINQQADIKSAGTLAVGMGSEQLTASLSGYYEAFFSEQEKAQKRADDLAKNWQQNAAKFADPAAFWGVDHPSAELPKTEAEFRKLVEALDLTRESGREAFAYLMQIAPAFDQVASAAEAMAASAEESAARLAETAAREAERAAQEQAAMLARLADQRRQLEIQLMDVSGDTAGATAARRSDELGAIDPTLRGLQQQIFDALDSSAARAAAEALAQEQARTAEEQLRAQEQIRAGWQRVADSMLDTIDRLRGELIGGGERGFAAAQADFAIATAAARAGDQAAASSLPELARAVVDLGREVATSSLDQARLTAATLSSLSATVGGLSGYGIALPQFAVGTNFVPADMVAQIHQGERIIPAGDNARLMQSSDDLLNEVRALRAEVVSLRAETRAVVNNTFDAALVLRRVMPDSDALAVRVVT